MGWASRRKSLYITGTLLFFGVPTAIFLFLLWYAPATCFDGIENQTETGIDKGGPCKLLDERVLIPHAILWTRAVPVRGGEYSAVAYIENPNPGAGVAAVPYRMRLYDAQNVLVGERQGVVSILPGRITPVYEGAVSAGERVATRAFLEFTAPLVWERYDDTLAAITVSNKRIENEAVEPRVFASIENSAPKDLRDIRFIAVAFDAAGNAFAASQTVLQKVEGKSRTDIVFTWPEAFSRRAARVDVLPYALIQ